MPRPDETLVHGDTSSAWFTLGVPALSNRTP